MRLTCDISIAIRIGASGQTRNQGKPVRASLAIGKKGNSDKATACLMLCTAKERNGTKYKIHGNILQIFNKFVQTGKATIRFNDPAHDLFISKADPSSLKSFLSLLKLSAKDIERVALSTLLPAKTSDLEKPKTELIIKQQSDYPLTKPFPGNLQRLSVTNCSMKCVDRRITKLKELTYLSLHGNIIKELPLGIASMKLSELHLMNNGLTEFHWGLCCNMLSLSLKVLDLRENSIKSLPSVFCNFKNLVHLKLDDNGLHLLPIHMGRMTSLRFFSASGNNLRVLPLSLWKLRLDSVDVSNNDFLPENEWCLVNNMCVPSLMELAGRSARKNHVGYSMKSLPLSLCTFLDNAKECSCGQVCFTSCIHYITKVNIHHIASTVVSAGPTQSLLPAEGYLCSQKCLLALHKSRARHVY
ncbi:leucine-rich repeat protein 1 [Nematostella vectensis]|uniref:leucine-rich repeat protein 1 n=1 Tax=Nematostella vectensis TaxID=45351 RepID=UPI0020770207|nr:leucine-rich repeat protein 1 [Nematostella vectensis]